MVAALQPRIRYHVNNQHPGVPYDLWRSKCGLLSFHLVPGSPYSSSRSHASEARPCPRCSSLVCHMLRVARGHGRRCFVDFSIRCFLLFFPAKMMPYFLILMSTHEQLKRSTTVLVIHTYVYVVHVLCTSMYCEMTNKCINNK